MTKDRDPHEFYQLYYMIQPYTMVSGERLWGLYNAVMSAVENEVLGDIVECGAARGGSAALMGLTLKALGFPRDLWVCDTFEGIPAPTADDPDEAKQYTGAFRGDLVEVQELFKQLGILDHCHLVKGLFQDTLPSLEVEKISVLHLDGDWYESTKCGLECLYDRVSPGGFIQIDDYGHWAGCRKAVEDFFFKRAFVPDLRVLDYTGVQFMKEAS
jgi:hypothetical protein